MMAGRTLIDRLIDVAWKNQRRNLGSPTIEWNRVRNGTNGAGAVERRLLIFIRQTFTFFHLADRLRKRKASRDSLSLSFASIPNVAQWNKARTIRRYTAQ